MLWPLDDGALVAGDDCDCDCVVWAGAPVSPPPPMRDEMDMLLPVPGRNAWPRPGSSLLAPKLGGYWARCGCDAWGCCCVGEDGGGICGRAKDGGGGGSWEGPVGELA